MDSGATARLQDDGQSVIKKMAGYHQFHAANVAVTETVRATRPAGQPGSVGEGGQFWARPRPGGEIGDQRAGVVWHTQGSGKSLTMAFYAGWIVQHPAMENPTLVVITDRNDLDDQLFQTFSRCRDLLRQTPVQAENRAHLRDLLKVASAASLHDDSQFFRNGGTLPKLSSVETRGHCRQPIAARRLIDGLPAMRSPPNSSFIGQGTSNGDRTRAVFAIIRSMTSAGRRMTATVPSTTKPVASGLKPRRSTWQGERHRERPAAEGEAQDEVAALEACCRTKASSLIAKTFRDRAGSKFQEGDVWHERASAWTYNPHKPRLSDGGDAPSLKVVNTGRSDPWPCIGTSEQPRGTTSLVKTEDRQIVMSHSVTVRRPSLAHVP